jgi:hypothetical protein
MENFEMDTLDQIEKLGGLNPCLVIHRRNGFWFIHLDGGARVSGHSLPDLIRIALNGSPELLNIPDFFDERRCDRLP